MKKILFAVIITTLFAIMTLTAFAAKPIVFEINGQVCELKNEIQNKDGRTMYPFRECMELLGAKVTWDNQGKIATGELNGTKVVFQIANIYYMINDQTYYMDTEPYIDNGRTYIPIRYAAEALGYEVDWIEGRNENKISVHEMTVDGFCKRIQGLWIELEEAKNDPISLNFDYVKVNGRTFTAGTTPGLWYGDGEIKNVKKLHGSTYLMTVYYPAVDTDMQKTPASTKEFIATLGNNTACFGIGFPKLTYVGNNYNSYSNITEYVKRNLDSFVLAEEKISYPPIIWLKDNATDEEMIEFADQNYSDVSKIYYKILMGNYFKYEQTNEVARYDYGTEPVYFRKITDPNVKTVDDVKKVFYQYYSKNNDVSFIEERYVEKNGSVFVMGYVDWWLSRAYEFESVEHISSDKVEINCTYYSSGYTCEGSISMVLQDGVWMFE